MKIGCAYCVFMSNVKISLIDWSYVSNVWTQIDDVIKLDIAFFYHYAELFLGIHGADKVIEAYVVGIPRVRHSPVFFNLYLFFDRILVFYLKKVRVKKVMFVEVEVYVFLTRTWIVIFRRHGKCVHKCGVFDIVIIKWFQYIFSYTVYGKFETSGQSPETESDLHIFIIAAQNNYKY